MGGLWLALMTPAAITGTPGQRDWIDFNGHGTWAETAAVQLPRTSLSVAAWVRLREVNRSQIFLSREGAPEQFTFYVFRDHVRLLIAFQPGRYQYATGPLPQPNVPTHYAGTWDGRRIRLYCNGKLAGEVDAKGAMAPSSAPICMGALEGGDRFLNGAMAEVQIWTRCLQTSEISALAATDSASPITPTKL